jgi:hypothetical protein
MCCDSMQMSVCKDAKVQNKDAQCLRIASRAIAKSISDQIKAFTESHFPEIKTVLALALRSLAPSRKVRKSRN